MTTQLSPESDAKLSANYVSSSCFKSKVRSRPIISRRRKRQLGCLAARAAAFLPINQKVKRKTLTMTRSIYVFESCPFCQTCVRSLHWDSRRGWIVWREPAHLPRFFHFLKRGTCFIYPCCVIECVKIIEGGTDYREFGCHQGCISCGILVSGIWARGVSSEHMENMEMFSCSPT